MKKDKYEFDPKRSHSVIAPHFFILGGILVWKKGENQLYHIPRGRLSEPDWIAHMFGKMDYKLFGEFVAAYITACHNAGLKKITIETFELVNEFAKPILLSCESK